MKIGIVFAGQGAQYPGMGKELYEHNERARQVFDEAGEEVKSWCFAADKETLRLTHITQPCVYTVTMAAYAAFLQEAAAAGLLTEEGESAGLEVVGLGGFSLGEYAALTAAGCLRDLDQGLHLVTLRGQLMEQAGLDEEGHPRGGMVAAFGKTAEIEAAVEEAAKGRILQAVNYNNPRQTVVAGETEALEDFIRTARCHRLKTKMLRVSTAFHCSMMDPAAEELLGALQEAAFAAPRQRIFSNITAEDIMRDYEGDPEDAPAVADYLARRMAEQVRHPVYFEKVIRRMIAEGAEAIVEVGPGDTLSGFVRKIDRAVPAMHVEDVESLEETLEELRELAGR